LQYNYIISAFLLHETSGSVRLSCDQFASSYSWSISDDGSAANAVILDTSSDKYTVVDRNSLDISLDNVTGVDGGLYRCVYDGAGTTPELCLYVYGESIYSDNSIHISMTLYNRYKSKCQV
jgi:hypothetical protein